MLNKKEIKTTQDKLNVNNYRNTLLSHFFNDEELTLSKLDDSDIKFRDCVFINNLNESILEIRKDIESRSDYIRGYSISLFQDINGFGIEVLLLPKSFYLPFENSFVMEFKDLLDDFSNTDLLFDQRRAKFTMRFVDATNCYTKSLKLPNFAFSVIREFVEGSQPITLWFDLRKQFDKAGNFHSK